MKFTVTHDHARRRGAGAKGTVKVHRLKQPDQVQRPDILARPPRCPAAAGRAAPVAPKPDPADPQTWELGEVVATLPFTTDAAGKAELTREARRRRLPGRAGDGRTGSTSR